jgi:hypothetical protein
MCIAKKKLAKVILLKVAENQKVETDFQIAQNKCRKLSWD